MKKLIRIFTIATCGVFLFLLLYLIAWSIITQPECNAPVPKLVAIPATALVIAWVIIGVFATVKHWTEIKAMVIQFINE